MESGNALEHATLQVQARIRDSFARQGLMRLLTVCQLDVYGVTVRNAGKQV